MSASAKNVVADAARQLNATTTTTTKTTTILTVHEAKNAHFWNLAFPAVRLIVLAFMFAFFGVIQSARAYTVIGSLFGGFIFSVSGVSFWVGCHGMIEAYASVRENFPDTNKLLTPTELQTQGILAVITTNRVVNDRYVEYRIDVAASGKEWFVWRRYSDFHKTFSEGSDFAKNVAAVKLPPKRWTGNHLSSSFISQRTDELNGFLTKFLKEHGDRRIDTVTAEFFGM